MAVITQQRFIVESIKTNERKPANRELWISEVGGLTQFGTYVLELQPDTKSSIKHWHTSEDELVYVLEGELCVVEENCESVIGVGDAATFKAGDNAGHLLWNRSQSIVRCLVVGTRATLDKIIYPDHGRICVRDRTQAHDAWTDMDGKPASNPYSDDNSHLSKPET